MSTTVAKPQSRKLSSLLWKLCLLTLGASVPVATQAWIITGLGTNNPRRIWLQVGHGAGALWANNATINLVSVTVPAAQLGNAAAQAMTSNSTAANSPYDGFAVCTPPNQVYVGAAYQRRVAGDAANANLQVTSPANLTTVAGDTIPFTEISWTVSALGGDPNPNAIPAGTFTGATQFLVAVAQGTLRENCHTFSYANTAVRPSGTYDGRVTYTLTSP
jgi:hypothetical protein